MLMVTLILMVVKLLLVLANNTLDFADDAKAQFGASDDLQIYHDGNHSIE